MAASDKDWWSLSREEVLDCITHMVNTQFPDWVQHPLFKVKAEEGDPESESGSFEDTGAGEGGGEEVHHPLGSGSDSGPELVLSSGSE